MEGRVHPRSGGLAALRNVGLRARLLEPSVRVVIVVNTVLGVKSQKIARAASGGVFSRALVTDRA